MPEAPPLVLGRHSCVALHAKTWTRRKLAPHHAFRDRQVSVEGNLNVFTPTVSHVEKEALMGFSAPLTSDTTFETLR